MSNAFNTIDRNLIMNQCKEHFPELLAWAKFCYGDHPKLGHILGSLSSQHGVQQGDPLGPLFFALGLYSVVKDIDAECQLLLHCWYLDDGVFCGTKSDVTKLLRILNDATPITGLNVKLSKCELYSKSDLSSFPADILRKHHEPNLENLGSPTGDETFCRDYILKKANDAEKLLLRLPQLENPQVAATLLRTCASFCKLGHLARTVPPRTASPALKEFDKKVRRCYEESVVVNTTQRSWTQAQLPVRLGGVGLRSVEEHSSAAFISSHTNAMGPESDLRLLNDAIEVYNDKIGDNQATYQASDLVRQEPLSERIDRHQFESLIESGSLVEKARLTSLAEPHAGDWILAQPLKDLGLAFSPNEYHMLVKWRLGLNLFPEKATCGSCPSETLDQFGQHALTCKRGPGICRRHNTLHDCIAEYCRRAQLNPTLEAGSGYLNQTRPADILLPTWNLGRYAALDVTVVNPLNNSNIEGAIIPGLITEEAADRKHRNNDAKCRELGWECTPIVVSTYGGWGSEARVFLDNLSSRVAMQTVLAKADIKRALFTRLSCTLMRANAQILVSRSLHFAGRTEIDLGGDPTE